MKRLALALTPLLLVVAACGSTPSSSESTPVAASSSTEITSLDDLHKAYLAAGGDCPSWNQDDAIDLALESGTCSDTGVLSVYKDKATAIQAAENYYVLFSQTGLDLDDELLIGDNWIVNTEDSDSVADQLGGEFYAYDPAKYEADEPTPPPANPSDFKRLSERQWKLITKDPDGHAGETIQIFGVITQFDAATGTAEFRADAGPSRSLDEYDYNTNSYFGGDEDQLADLVEGDFFSAKVWVEGALSYDTTSGGSMTVPQFTVYDIQRIG